MRSRRVAVAVHRYVGLFIAAFLVVAGLTGSVLAFNEQLDAAINPDLFRVEAPHASARRLDPFEIHRRVQQSSPAASELRWVQLHVEEGSSVVGWTQDEPGVYRQWFIDPYTGDVLGSRVWGDPAEGRAGIMPFVYRLHFSLGLGTVGTLLFGIVAALWTLDCLVAAFLTFPTRRKSSPPRPPWIWVRRWLPAWWLQTHRRFALLFTWHRASGLWLWGFLFVFAWSAVGFNLPYVYQPAMGLLAEMKAVGHESLPHLAPPYPTPTVTMQRAHHLGREAMAQQAEDRGFEVVREQLLYYAEDHGVYGYLVSSSEDLPGGDPQTEVYIDGQTGECLGFSAPTGIAAGNTISSWLKGLHTGAAVGPAYRVMVSMLGVLVSVLSLTGVWLWVRRRRRKRTT